MDLENLNETKNTVCIDTKTNEEEDETKIDTKANEEEQEDETKKCPFNTNKICNSFYNVIQSVKENYLSWIFIFTAVTIMSYPTVYNGITTFFLMALFAYLVHYGSHKYRNIFTIAHHYHHENSNFLSHFIQIILECSIILVFAPLYFIYGKIFFNEWVVLFFLLFYSSIHNINYSILRVNDVHYLHHQFILTNVGPDIFDIMFYTKNEKDTSPENTNHYIPNIIIGTIIILFLQYLYKNDKNKHIMSCLLKTFLSFCFTIVTIFSIYIWNFK
jgi:hypothetical protein